MKKRILILGGSALLAAGLSAAQTIPLVVPDSASCATSIDGTVVGVRNPLQVAQISVVYSGTLPAGNYFVKITWYDAAGNQTLAGPESQIQLASTGSIVVQPPASGMPLEAAGTRVYISASTNTETLQGSVAGTGTYTQSVPLVTGAALPSTNTTLCEIIANDAGWPSGTGYDTVLTSPNGSTQPGYPMQWQFLNPGSTYNLSQGLPLYNGTTTYPIPIMARPYNHGPQSISGHLSMTGYKLTQVSYLGIGTSVPAWGVDAEVPPGGSALEGVVNAATGFLVNGGAGTTGQGLCSDGNYFDLACTFVTSLPTLHYQTVQANAVDQAQQAKLNFSSYFTLSNTTPSTTVDVPNVGTAGTYAYPSSISTDAKGRVTSVTAGTIGSVNLLAKFDGNSCTLGDDGTGGSGATCTTSWGSTIAGTYYYWCQPHWDPAATTGCANLGNCSALLIDTVSQTATDFTYTVNTRLNASRGHSIGITCWASN